MILRTLWDQEFIRQDTSAAILNFLSPYTTGHAGTIPAAMKDRAVKLLHHKYGEQAQSLFAIACDLCHSGNHTGEEIGVMLLPATYTVDPQAVRQMLEVLVDSSHWEVREWAASAAGQILFDHYDDFHVTLIRWLKDPSANLRRGAIVAIKVGSSKLPSAHVAYLLDVLQPLLADRDPYVKKNLGPYVLGDGLIKSHPELVLSRLKAWVELPDETARWNVAMVFTAQAGAKHAHDASSILNILATDSRPSVIKALAKARNAIAKYQQH